MSNAPKDATHYLPVKEGVRAEPGYWKKVGDDAFAWSMDGCWTWTGKDTLPAAAIEIKRDEPVAWDLEALPPVGTVCEFFGELTKAWFKAEVVFSSEWVIVIRGPDSSGKMVDIAYDAYKARFRPIRTPEQIAAEERHSICHEAQFSLPNRMVTNREIIEHTYDLMIANGYRKQEAAE